MDRRSRLALLALLSIAAGSPAAVAQTTPPWSDGFDDTATYHPGQDPTNLGTRVWGQFWGRDTVATGSYVSSGLTWVVGP
jgi:hypothetical protein